MANIEIYRDYTFMDNDDYKYCLSVEDDFTTISYYEFNIDKWHKVDELEFPTPFAYEIAKKIIEEYERMNNNGMA